MAYAFELVELINKERAVKQNLSCRITAICLNGEKLVRVIGEPNSDILFDCKIESEIKKLNQLNYPDLVQLKPYEVFTTNKLKKGHREKINRAQIVDSLGIRKRRGRKPKLKIDAVGEVLQHS